MPATTDSDARRALRERVSQRVAGSGIPAAVIADAVNRVVDSLPKAGGVRGQETDGHVVAAVSAQGIPDLASRLRRDLERAGLVLKEMGIGQAGRYTVVTLSVPESAKATLQHLAEGSGLSISFQMSTDAANDPR